ncbi:protein of unknown function (plasmid) [Caballeronia sp. S22]
MRPGLAFLSRNRIIAESLIHWHEQFVAK